MKKLASIATVIVILAAAVFGFYYHHIDPKNETPQSRAEKLSVTKVELNMVLKR